MVAQLDGRWGEAFRFAPGQVKLRFLDCACARSDHGDEDTKADRPRESRYVQEEQDTRALISSQPFPGSCACSTDLLDLSCAPRQVRDAGGAGRGAFGAGRPAGRA